MNKPSTNLRSEEFTEIELIREYWNEHPHEYRLSKHSPGTVEYFMDIKSSYDKKYGYNREFVDYESLKGKKILEIGCGLGIDLVQFAKAGAITTGMDISDFAVEMSRKNLEIHNLKADVFRGDGEYLAFEDESFDSVFAISSIPYTQNPEKMIREIHRVLKKGGEAYLVVYNSGSWLNMLFRIFNMKSQREDAPAFHKYSIKEFERLLRVFSGVKITTDRFPIKTDRDNKIHTALYNNIFVPIFNLIPKKYLKSYGHHTIAIAVK